MGRTFNNDLYHLHIYIGVYEITDINEDISIMCDKANLAIKTLYDNYAKSIAYYNDTIFNDTIKNSLSVILKRLWMKNSFVCTFSLR